VPKRQAANALARRGCVGDESALLPPALQQAPCD
jgi:hypothetical protein